MIVAIALTAIVFLWIRFAASASEEEETRGTTGQAVGAGRWQSQRDGLGSRDWHLQLKRFDDDSIEGSLIIVGSELNNVRLEGRVDGDDVYGAMVDDSNRQVGTFTGSIFAGGVSGTYATTSGDTGNWTWAGPAGARSLKPRSNQNADAEPAGR
jgi:hypothetical protein